MQKLELFIQPRETLQVIIKVHIIGYEIKQSNRHIITKSIEKFYDYEDFSVLPSTDGLYILEIVEYDD